MRVCSGVCVSLGPIVLVCGRPLASLVCLCVCVPGSLPCLLTVGYFAGLYRRAVGAGAGGVVGEFDAAGGESGRLAVVPRVIVGRPPLDFVVVIAWASYDWW